jgi:flagellar operon protein
MSFKINNGYIQPLLEPGQQKRDKNKIHKNQNSFQNILEQQIQKSNGNIKVSSHANRRLSERNITLNDRDLQSLSKAMDKAKEKGAKESLMIYKDMAFIASIRNRTLITAMDPKNSNEKIFTNIDSAVIVD